jgi:hypothetical protein
MTSSHHGIVNSLHKRVNSHILSMGVSTLVFRGNENTCTLTRTLVEIAPFKYTRDNSHGKAMEVSTYAFRGDELQTHPHTHLHVPDNPIPNHTKPQLHLAPPHALFMYTSIYAPMAPNLAHSPFPSRTPPTTLSHTQSLPPSVHPRLPSSYRYHPLHLPRTHHPRPPTPPPSPLTCGTPIRTARRRPCSPRRGRTVRGTAWQYPWRTAPACSPAWDPAPPPPRPETRNEGYFRGSRPFIIH